MAKVTVVERATPVMPPIESVTIQLTADEAKAVATMCSFGFMHASAPGRKLMEANGVGPSRNLLAIYGVLVKAGVKVRWDV